MADILNKSPIDGGVTKRNRDMGDGTWAEVMATVEAGAAVGAAGYPNGATPVNSASGNVANAAAVATLAGVASKTTYITGFAITAAGATAGLAVSVTVVGILGGTLTYTFVAPTGALVGANPLIVNFQRPIPASALNTAIVVTCPALGVGNTNATANAHGFQL